MEKDLVLALDCDGCVVDTVGIVEEFISKINYCCSNEFKTKIMDRAFYNGEMELFNKYSKINRITRDEVLEEVYDLYKDRIDYNELYQLSNAFDGVIDILNFFYKRGVFKKMYIVSHVNSAREIEAKTRFFEKYLPFMKLIFIPFHDIPYDYDKDHYFENASRKRTNKAEYFFKITGEDKEKTIFVDDSETICSEATEKGCRAFYRDRRKDDPLYIFRKLYDNITGIESEEEAAKKLYKEFYS